MHEWIFSEFLRHLTELVHKGLRFDYHLVEDEHSAFIRGQLNITAQMRQPLVEMLAFMCVMRSFHLSELKTVCYVRP